jgi:hypothetical protein
MATYSYTQATEGYQLEAVHLGGHLQGSRAAKDDCGEWQDRLPLRGHSRLL